MRKLYRGATIAVAVLSLFLTERVKAFSLLGPYTDWMTQTNGYQTLNDIGGPMSLNAGYRWNVPVITYAFDQSFVDYFGTNGVAAVEGAIAVLNNLPPASQLDPSNFPLSTLQVNISAEAQSLIDLKSTSLFLLLEQMGLAKPSRFTSAVHGFTVTDGTVDGVVVQRNYDPFSLAPTNGVNGVHYSYTLFLTHSNPDYVNWSVYPIDPWESGPAVADQDPSQISNRGFFLTGLTRDDVGGLRYLLGTNNYNFETLLPDVHGVGTNAVNYANAIARAGVDKIMFVRQNYDLLSGQAFTPLTNDYVDTYMTNSTVVRQQLERIVSKPDIIFSAFSDDGSNVLFKRTGTTNWLNESVNLDGPGIIRPQINIAFQKFGMTASVETTDDSSSAFVQSSRWASFDASTNPPVIFPAGSGSGSGNIFQINLFFGNTNFTAPNVTWHVPVALGATATLQTSTNLLDWTTKATVQNDGMPLNWSHFCTVPQNFFRVVPESVLPANSGLHFSQ